MDLSQDANALSMYMQNVAKGSVLLNKEQEYKTAIAVASGDRKAKTLMIESNLRLVIHLAKAYKYSHVPLIDIIQEGNAGLIHAVEKFDVTKGFRFSTYAVWWIKNHIDRYIMKHGRMIRVPINIGNVYKKITKVGRDNQLDINCNDDLMIISEILNISIDKLREVKSHYYNELSLDCSFIVEDKGDKKICETLEDESIITPSAALDVMDNIECLLDVLNYLSPRDRQIVELRFGLNGDVPLSLDKISKEFLISREKTRGLIRKVLKQMKTKLLMNDLDKCDYMA